MVAAILQGLGSGAILALFAIGLVLIFKGSKVLNLAHGELGAVALMAALAITRFPTSAWMGPVVLVLTVVLAIVFGLVIEALVMRRLVDRSPVQGTMATLGIAIVLIYAVLLQARLFLPPGSSGFPVPVTRIVGTGSLGLFGASLKSEQVLGIVLTLAVGVGLTWFFTNTRFGLGVVAATSDHTVARILGIPVRRVAVFTWGVGGALAGMAAALTAPIATQIQPGLLTFATISALAGAVIGGLDSLWGAVIGSLLVGVTIAVVEQVTGNAAVGDLAVLALVVGTLLLRPRGLLGGAGVAL